MTDYRNKIDPKNQLNALRGETAALGDEEPVADEIPEAENSPDAFSIVADRRQKLMVAFRFQDGNAKALSYGYLVAIDFDPSEGIAMDFSGYEVRLKGRNLGPLFSGLVSQRIGVVQEADALHADATLPKDATVVTAIEITPPG
jgi:hypothetical protein